MLSDRLEKLNEKARALPKAPGVYLMKDDKGRVIYVGKSSSLRERVTSYFQPSTKLEHKKVGLLEQVVDFDILQTDSEVEALLAENRLIKDIQPRYNARLLDDKTFPYLMITLDDDFPGVFVTRQPRTSGVKLYGPFTSVGALKEAVTLMQRAFKFRTCHLDIRADDTKRRFFRPCLLYPIKQCTGPCADKVSQDAYREDIQRLIKYLDGGKKGVIKELEKEMIEASKDLHFEKAAKLRDEIKALTAIGARPRKGNEESWQPEAFVSHPQEGMTALQQVLQLPEMPRILEAIDIAHLQGGEMVGSKVTFIDGVPFKDSYRRYKIKHGQGNNDFLSIQEVVSRRYRDAGESHELYPDIILIDGGLGQLNAAMDVFTQMNVKPPMVIGLAKKEELVYIQGQPEPVRLPRNNAGLRMLQYIRDEAHRFAQRYHHLLRSKAQIEQETAEGRRPPARKKFKPDPATAAPLPPLEPNRIPLEQMSDAEARLLDGFDVPLRDFIDGGESQDTSDTASPESAGPADPESSNDTPGGVSYD